MKILIISIILFILTSCNYHDKESVHASKINMNSKETRICYFDYDFFKSPLQQKLNPQDSVTKCIYIYDKLKEKLYCSLDTSIKYKIFYLENKMSYVCEFYSGGFIQEIIITSINEKVFKIGLRNFNNNNKVSLYINSIEIINKNNECEEFDFSSKVMKIESKNDLPRVLNTLSYSEREQIKLNYSYYKYKLNFQKDEVVIQGKLTFIDDDLNGKLITKNYDVAYETKTKFNLSRWIFYSSFMAEKSRNIE